MGKPKPRRRKFNGATGRNSPVFRRKKVKGVTENEVIHVPTAKMIPKKCSAYKIVKKFPSFPGKTGRIIVKRLMAKPRPLRILQGNEDGMRVSIVAKEVAKPDGYRIISVNNLTSFITAIVSHSIKCFSSGTLNLSGDSITTHAVSEQCKYGLASTLRFKCKCCGEDLDLQTSPIHPGSQTHDINMRAVWGSMATGGGSSSLNELLSTMGVPGMRSDLFSSLETTIGDSWRDLLLEDMRKAGEEEKQLAIARNDYHQGIPAITVVCDGGWSKRSHRHTYNAMGGVGVIFGAATGKLLHIGVRNKHCYICSMAESRNMVPKEHRCFRNWTESSQAMESHIIVEGFRKAEEEHGLRYMRFIGDGDSSVFARIQEEVPVWGRDVTKLECANHACKCLRSNLEKLVDEKPHFKGKGRLTKNTIVRLTKGVRCAIRMRSSEGNRQESVRKLAHDIRNSVHHVFGNHENCSDFCKKRDPVKPTNLPNPDLSSVHDDIAADINVPEIADTLETTWKGIMEEDGLEEARYGYPSGDKIDPEILKDVSFLLHRMASKSERLLGNFTTNLAESWMFIRCKFDGGKIFNRCNRGSWHCRCYGGALRKNFGAAWSPVVWHRLTGVPPGSAFALHYRQRALNISSSKKSKNNPDVKTRCYKRKQTTHQQAHAKKAKKEYGLEALEATPDVSPEELKTLCEDYIEREIDVEVSSIEEIEKATVGQSFSSRWVEERKKRLTSSSFGDVMSRSTTRPVGPLVKRVIYPTFGGNAFTKRGLREESVTIKEYIQKKEELGLTVTVNPSGLVIDKEHKYLAASPDGCVKEGKEQGLIEVKNLLQNNQISFKEAAKKGNFCLQVFEGGLRLKKNHKYFFQCQGLMNICDVPWVDFVVRRTNPYQMYIERIYRDGYLWKNVMIPKLFSFYRNCMLPELVCPRLNTIAGLREPKKPWFESVQCVQSTGKGQKLAKRTLKSRAQGNVQETSVQHVQRKTRSGRIPKKNTKYL